jgi:DNA-3-methyladenine glycosylase
VNTHRRTSSLAETPCSYDVVVSQHSPSKSSDARSRQLGQQFFGRAPDVVAKELLGTIMTVRGDRVLRTRILETEAYDGLNDPASHAYRGPTPRTAIMFGPPGFLYVYLSYGVHWCMNIVTGQEGTASAVLLRAAEVTDASDRSSTPVRLIGPGNLTRGLGITGADNGLNCCLGPRHRLSLAAAQAPIDPRLIGRSPRIGLSRAQDRLSRYFLTPEIAK